MTFDRIVFVAMILFIFSAVLMIVDFEAKDEECRKRGGTTISTSSGRVCAKIERL